MAKEKPSKVPLTLRLPRALYEELKEEAEHRGLSLHEYILVKLNPLSVVFEQESPRAPSQILEHTAQSDIQSA